MTMIRILPFVLQCALLCAAGVSQDPAAQDPAVQNPAAQEPAPQPTPVPVLTQDPPLATAAPVAQNRIGEAVLSPRVRNITRLHNSMPHLLVGVGIVTGLATTGSSDRGTRQALLNVVRQLGINLSDIDVVGGSTTLVTVTCSLPPFAKQGQTLDVKCEIITDSLSLRGGELLRCELRGVDGKPYVVAQGSLVVSGFTAAGTNASASKNPSGTAWLHNGGIVVQEEPSTFFSESGALELQLLNPSPFNCASVAKGIRTALDGSPARVSAVDASLVRIELPDDERTSENAMRILNLIGEVRVAVENPAKVMVDQTSGTVLAGEGVLISPCVVGLSELTISIVNEEEVVQPNEFSYTGETQRVGRTRIETRTDSTDLRSVGGAGLGGATVSDLLANLKALGLTPAQLVSVFQALDQGGFLHATLEVR